jgi:DNA-binding beta-propeller fold protein YncE
MKNHSLLFFSIVIFALLTNESCTSFIKKNDYEKVNQTGLRYDDTTLFAEKSPYLMPYNRVIDGVGTSINFGSPDVENHSLDVAMIPNSRLVVVEDRYGIAVFDVDKKQLVSRLSFAETPQYKNALSSFSGIKAVVFKDSTYIFWGAGVREKSDSYVMQAVWNGQKLSFVRAIPFKAVPPATLALPNEVSVQEENGDLFLYTVLNGNNQIKKVKVNNQEVVWTAPTGVAPFGLNVVGDMAFVTNWAGPVTNPTDGFETAGVPWGSAYINPKTGAISRGTVSVFDVKTGQLKKEINVGLHPNAVISSADKQFIYVANGNSDYISVISTQNLTVVDSIFVGLFKEHETLIGSTPNALALDNTGSILYVANGLDNAIAVVSLGKRASNAPNTEGVESRVKGFIPTQAYPSGIVFDVFNSYRKSQLVITNLEAIGARVALKVNEAAKAEKAFNAHRQLASVSFIPLPTDAELKILTEKVKAQSLYKRAKLAELLPRKNVAPRPVPERIGEPSVFKHVLYIIKENRTYDQVLGDMKEGDGMASLCIFGDSVTPNLHQIAREYMLLDNYHVSGKSSAEGHHWASAGMVTDYTEKSVRAWFRSYPHVLADALVYNKKGMIWNNALDNGKTVRIYGEACTCEFDNKSYNWRTLYALQQKGQSFPYKNTTTISRVRPILATDFPGCDNEIISDQMRADAFLKELKTAESDPNGQLPNLMIMSLPNDHTSGTNPNFPTPRAMVADNDLAVGRIVEALMNSRFGDSLVIFISEDDSQSGWDHVSAYRTTGYVVSKYSHLQKTVKTNYNQTSLLRTIEQILGLPPMNIIDATASPMFDCFSQKMDTTYKFVYKKNLIPLNEMNKPLTELKGTSLKHAKQSLEYAFNLIDRGHDDILNRILWFSSKGKKPYPAHLSGKGDDDDE